ncbi:calcineurin temperature suppressor Cts1 [Rhodotorula toruloides]|uniref:Calcineurin temperature suppressor Cts1 n=1 Tax=Rhodotorula toruloides TaxID=5286 RepID=A0A511KGT3_RHOTO|nr:calcineurin temperature suppressor Cts1 [Rhodotorula toruloides]
MFKTETVFWDYYHTDSRPYTAKIAQHGQSAGKAPWMASGVWTWSRFWTALPFTFATVRASMKASKEAKAGVKHTMCTIWGDEGNEFDLYSVLPGILYHSELAYTAREIDEFDAALFSPKFDGSVGADLDDYVYASKLDDTQPEKPFFSFVSPQYRGFDLEHHFSALASYFEQALSTDFSTMTRVSLPHSVNDFPLNSRLRLPYLLASVLSLKCHLRERLVAAYKSGDREELEALGGREPLSRMHRLRALVKELHDQHRENWFDMYKPFGWEVLDLRYGGLQARLETMHQRLIAYLDSNDPNVTKVEELEVELETVYPNSCFLMLDYSRAARATYIYRGRDARAGYISSDSRELEVLPDMVQLPPSASPTSAERLLGTLVVIVLRAKNLPNRVRIGKQNPYATVTYGLHKKRTDTIERGGQQPEWDAEFRFEILKDGLGGEEQLAADQKAVVTSKGGVLPANSAAGGGTDAASKHEKRDSNSLVVAPLATGHPPGRRVLRIACWADDARDPKLIGEGELDIEETIKVGKFDDWIKLERKGRYAGEVYLELTWYSNEPRPVRTSRKASVAESPTRAGGAYGGAGSRVEDHSGSEAGTEEWDGGSQIGLASNLHKGSQASLSSVASAPAELAADYPDADVAPLASSMSTMSISRPPLPQPPAPVSSPPYGHQVHPSQTYRQFPPAPLPSNYGSYSHAPPAAAYASYSAATSYAGMQAYQQPYAGYGALASEFGQYAPPQQVPQPPQQLGEFEQLAHDHHASQGYPYASTSSHRPLPQPTPAAPAPPSLQYDSYSSASYPPLPAQTPYPQPPIPPIPPSNSAYWQQHPTAPPSSSSYPALPHSSSQTTIYAPPQRPQPPQPPSSAFSPTSAFAHPPLPPSIANTFAPLRHSGSLPQIPQPPVPPQPPSFAPPPVFSPPLPPSLQAPSGPISSLRARLWPAASNQHCQSRLDRRRSANAYFVLSPAFAAATA